ncbi:AraC family transcriptional regulator [Terrimonas sp. NA20]|uniref:AraC family transcriptional regulator n=1 Tax=Terrimonas ginsenosidimutans TaxID=2908004 RepID=A0ABS9KT88_9BACT|nr:AraC family transcriptional regulator [Terrimonas ginsenosidimutans]MCG2615556.1 AraC family transcriptional regulator [Terrimonas ginsenosidimutans]
MEIYIRNMVCDRCIKSVRHIFEKMRIETEEIRLGVVYTKVAVPDAQVRSLKDALREEGFEWMDDQKAKMVELIKSLLIQLVQTAELDEMKGNLSAYLSKMLLKDYHYLSQLFSSMENTTIEQYFILQKIEKVKEWLVYDEFSVSEIAFKLGYSSVSHLSGQFKKVTGFTPSEFKQFKDHYRKPLDKV